MANFGFFTIYKITKNPPSHKLGGFFKNKVQRIKELTQSDKSFEH